MAANEDTFWRVQDYDIWFWDAYVGTRPDYSQSFYDEIFGYHGEHSSTWDIAHDVACGAGQMIINLAARFQYVVASDCHDTHLRVAKHKSAGLDRAKASFVLSKAEEMHQHYPNGSSDLIVCSEAIPAMDEVTALQSFHNILRPGGTLAISFYGRPIFTEPHYLKCQSTLDTIMDHYFNKLFRANGDPIPETKMKHLRRASGGMASWLDYLDFDPAKWSDVKRIKWNPKSTMEFFGENITGIPPPRSNKIRSTETVVKIDDPEWWCKKWSNTDLRLYFKVLFPGFETITDSDDEKLESLFQRMEEEMGGRKAIRNFTWATVLVMATKK